MSLKLVNFENVKKALRFSGKAFSMAENFRARIDTPILLNGEDLWKTSLASKTIIFYGGLNEENRYRFKIDHAFNLESLAEYYNFGDNAIEINDSKKYDQSQGTEFIVIFKDDFKKEEGGCAIRADKYQKIKKILKGGYPIEDLEEIGGFKVCEWLMPEEVEKHDGWLELAVGKNKASQEDYAQASELLKSYVKKANAHKFYQGKNIMEFSIEINPGRIKHPIYCDYKVRLLEVKYGDCGIGENYSRCFDFLTEYS